MRKARSFLCLLAALYFMLYPSLCWGDVYFSKPPEEFASKPVLRWTVFDVNEGDAMLLECGGESMLVDGGPDPSREMLRDELTARGLQRGLKYILLTHAHDDHADGIIRLFEYGFRPGEFLHPYDERTVENNYYMKRAVPKARRGGVAVRQVNDCSFLYLGDAEIRIYQCTEYADTNARSLMLKVTFGNTSLLLTADITGKAQLHFADTLPAGVLKADILKLPHHFITPVNAEFLAAVSPLAAVATNQRERVDAKSLNQLTQHNLPALFSGDGTVYAVTDGTDWYLYQDQPE